jgi:serpin B
VASALGLAAAGARGRTQQELAAALAPGGSLAELGQSLAASAKLSGGDIAVANTLWVRLGLPVRDTYRQEVLGWPAGAVRDADFRADPDGARREINTDVARATRQLITDLLAPGAVQADTAAVIVNALYLKVAWRTVFPEAATSPSAFRTPQGVRQVPTMRQQSRLDYAAAGGWAMVTLPTASEVAVDVLLPETDSLDPPPLSMLYAASTPIKVDLALPKFRVETAATLNETLGRLGVVTAFSRGADFGGITEGDDIFIDSVVHKAVLRVDEQGFEGAAATAVTMRLTSVDLEPPVPFHVDRPFLLVVRHRATGAVYFLARVTSP